MEENCVVTVQGVIVLMGRAVTTHCQQLELDRHFGHSGNMADLPTQLDSAFHKLHFKYFRLGVAPLSSAPVFSSINGPTHRIL